MLEDKNELRLHYRPIRGLPKKTAVKGKPPVCRLREVHFIIHFVWRKEWAMDSWIGIPGYRMDRQEKSAWIVSGLQVASLEDQGEMIYGRGI